MEMKRCVKPSFCVIGKEGSTDEGEGFIQRLWAEANGRFAEIAPLAKRDASGNLVGLWGAMSDLSRAFRPWEDGFTRGLYLAGVEAEEGAQAPEGWSRWVVPAFAYLRVRVDRDMRETFASALGYLKENGLALSGAVQEFYRPGESGQLTFYFPIGRA